MTFIQFSVNDWRWPYTFIKKMELKLGKLNHTNFAFTSDMNLILYRSFDTWSRIVSIGDWIIINDQGEFFRDLYYLPESVITKKNVWHAIII